MRILFITLFLLSFLPIVAAQANPADNKASRDISKLVVHEHAKDMQDLSFLNVEQQKQTLSIFKGKMIVLNLWATWCPPCREELPSLDSLHSLLGDRPFVVVAVSLDHTGLSRPKEFYQQANITNLDLYNDPTVSLGRHLGVIGLPVTIIIDPEGREIARLQGDAKWDQDPLLDWIKKRLDHYFSEEERGQS